MLLKKLADLAERLDQQGHHEEAGKVDGIMKFIAAGMEQCMCDCPGCKNEDKHECGCQACMFNDDGATCGCG